ncbi:FG-GAP repeat domain-containing protein [Streptomyces sp. NPDC059247]|uniref:FG-GAP repeat domain-containing protein n=1 Tax=Streptomyces sp. NPDC059247 TaxID=3346790 RepID=UPI0036BB9AF3
MSRARSHHRLTAAVAVALAVTAGLGPAVSPAQAAPPAVSPAQAAPPAVSPALAAPPAAAPRAALAADPGGVTVPFPDHETLKSAGRTGFFTQYPSAGIPTPTTWTRYEDGTATVLPAGTLPPLGGTAVTTRREGTVHTLSDLDTGAEPVVIDTALLGSGYGPGRAVGPATLFSLRTDAAGYREIHLITRAEDGTLTDGTVTGLPEGARAALVAQSSADTLAFRYTTGPSGSPFTSVALVDVTSRKVVGTYESGPPSGNNTEVAVDSTHVAWVESNPSSHDRTVVVVHRATGETKRVTVLRAGGLDIELLSGGWLLYGTREGFTSVVNRPSYTLTARSLTTDETVPLLDHFVTSVAGPDGTALLRGGTLADGEGLYRIATGPDGRPSARLVATTGKPTALTLYGQETPGRFDLDRQAAPLALNFTFDRPWPPLTLELTHTATGRTRTLSGRRIDDTTTMSVAWDGKVRQPGALSTPLFPAPNGAYTWRMTARPGNGIGPAVEADGSFTVTREAVPHDFNDNGAPDILARDGDALAAQSLGTLGQAARPGSPDALGTGWGAYDRLLTPGDLGGTPHADILSRDPAGVLRVHQGTGTGLAAPVRIGGGWQVYEQITGGPDLTGDGRPDLLATDKSGLLWLYKGTGDAVKPFAPRVKAGTGWGVYDLITVTGNVGGAPGGDFVARDRAGVLWLYLGKGDGTYAPRTRIGGGWNAYNAVVSFGDHDRDGRPDLLADAAGTPYVYRNTGDWRAPFAPREEVYSRPGAFGGRLVF